MRATLSQVLAFGLGLLAPLVGRADEAKPAPAADKAKPPEFMRVVRDADKTPVALETAIVSYVSADGSKPGLVVELVGAVHVADKAYYKRLNERFETYDSLLFELVAPEGTVIPKGGKREGPQHPVASLQLGMKSMLDLDFQLEQIDYTKKNFVHADMSPDEFSKSMKDRGESFVQLIFKLMGQSLAMQSDKSQGDASAEMLFALFSPSSERSLKLRRAVATQFDQMGGQLKVLDGPDGSTLLTERNKKALVVLDREIKAGKKKIGIFYGAAHLPDMEKRLLADFGLKRDKSEWLAAWDLHTPAAKPAKPAEKK